MEVNGKHVICEIWGADPDLLDDMEYILRLMKEAAEIAGATIRAEATEQFQPQGVSAILLLSESHISIHTYPEHGYAAVDCFTCGKHCMPIKACGHIVKNLGEYARAHILYLTRPFKGDDWGGVST